MAKKKVADLWVEVLPQAGVRRIYGVSGDSLTWITDSIRAKKQIQWVHVRHEETTAFAQGSGSASDWAISRLRRELRSRLERVFHRRCALFSD
jgi:TPP-dependent 2-oxoacid decarboxylase